VQWLTAPIAIVVDVLTFVIAGTLIGAIRRPEAQPPPRDAHILVDMLEGLKRRARRGAAAARDVRSGAQHRV
jgi:hypothetical protein